MPKYIRSPNCEAVHLDGEWMILHAEHCTVTKINEVGGFCWNLLHQPQTLSSLVKAVKTNYSITDDSSIDNDIQTFLSDLMNCGLVENAS